MIKLALAVSAAASVAGVANGACAANEYKATSVKTCEELKLDPVFGSNVADHPTIDGLCQLAAFDASAGDNGCVEDPTFQENFEMCASIGMRLCKDGEPARVGGCSASSRKVWYDAPCDDGKAFLANSENNNDFKRQNCVNDVTRGGHSLLMFCCADASDTTENECETCPDESIAYSPIGATGKTTCVCPPGYEASYDSSNNMNGINGCTRISSGDWVSCSANTYAERSAAQCDTETGLIATNGYEDKTTFCIANKKVDPEEVCPPTEMPWTLAEKYCHKHGARLCSLSELRSNNALKGLDDGSCEVEDEKIHTSTPCSDDGSKMIWYNAKSGKARCADSETVVSDITTVCCADVGTDVTCKSCPMYSESDSGSNKARDCSCIGSRDDKDAECIDTMAPTTSPTASPDCPENTYKRSPTAELATARQGDFKASDFYYGFTPRTSGDECPAEFSYDDAVQLCEDNNARLCTLREIRMGETKGTGCGFDLKHVWSSTPCCTEEGTCGNEKYAIHIGKGKKGRYGLGKKQECQGPNQVAAVRCCRDVRPKAWCQGCSGKTTSNAGSTDISDCKCMEGYWGRDGGECTKI